MSDLTEHRARGFVPPYLLERLAAGADPGLAASARRTMEQDDLLRRSRQRPDLWVDERRATAPTTAPTAAAGAVVPAEETAGPAADRVVSDAGGTTELPGTPVRREGEAPTRDAAADEAYDGLGLTWDLFFEGFGRDSLDGAGMPLLATVHYDRDYDNAFWDGEQMVFGDGDGRIFNRFTLSLDVIGHELAHGVTEHTAGLMYRDQPGALNESVSDVFGVLVRQRALGQRADEADWLIGADLFTDAVQGEALRSMKAPGTAYDDPVLGKDPQPGHMDDYVRTAEDNGGVHVNSGIPNRAFCEAATALGGRAWEAPGQVWYDAITGDISADCDFVTFADLTVSAATRRFGADSAEARAVRQGWETVGVLAAEAVSAEGEPSGGEAAEESGEQAGGETPAGEGPPESGEGPPATPGAPPPQAELLLRRTGGFTGLPRERALRLEQLPEEDTRDWRHLLGGRTLQGLADRGTRPDAFNYRVSCVAVGLDVTLAEEALPGEVHRLFERTLQGPAPDDQG